MSLRIKQRGFTLVELLLAMAFFSFILLFVTTGFIIINRSYNKGITSKMVQDEARSTLEFLTREIRTTPAGSITTTTGCLSVGANSYYWTERVDDTNTASPFRLLYQPGVNCSDMKSVDLSTDLLNDRVGVQYLDISPTGTGSSLSLTLILSTVSTDLIDGVNSAAKCFVESGSQYCDVVEVSTVVSPR